MLLRSEVANPCPACQGCMPGYGPDDLVCTCGANWDQPGLVPVWVPALRQLIGELAGLLADPGLPDPQDRDAEEDA